MFVRMLWMTGFFLTVSGFAAADSCIRGDCQNGYGHKQYGDGSLYEGEFKAGKRSGQGTFRHVSGVVYEGGFYADRFEGQGVMTHTDGRRYEGSFKEGTYHGPGEYRWGDGAVYAGEFNAGEFYTGILSYPDGNRRVYEGGKRLE